MNVGVADLVTELKSLRKGRAIQTPRIGDRIGPALRAVCGITADDDVASVRLKVAARLTDLSAELPGYLQIALTAAFGLDEALHTQFYKERLLWAERVLERNTRTVRRRIDEAIAQLAELAVHRLGQPAPDRAAAPAAEGWHSAEIRQSLRLDQDVPEAMELRRIVADGAGLAELDLALTVTAPAPGEPVPLPGTGIEVLYGGRLREVRMESSDRIGYRLALPAPLGPGQEHEYGVRFRPQGRLEPHFVCVPRQRCDVCVVRVRFVEDRPPLRVERLDGVFQRDIADPNSAAPEVTVDGCGEVRVRFTGLAPNLAYGVRWTPGRP